MDDEAVNTFAMFTGASEDVARRYLGLTDQNVEQAVELFFNSPELASAADSQPVAPPIPSSTRPSGLPGQQIPGVDGNGSGMDYEPSDDESGANAASVDDDEAMARRLQEGEYAGGHSGAGFQEDTVRAPMERTTETLVGPSAGHYEEDDDNIHARMRAFREARRGMYSGC